jgi:hypothetical protein
VPDTGASVAATDLAGANMGSGGHLDYQVPVSGRSKHSACRPRSGSRCVGQLAANLTSMSKLGQEGLFSGQGSFAFH